MLNKVGASTLPCGSPFFYFLHLLRSLFSSTYNLLLDSKFWITTKFTVLCGVVEFLYQKSMFTVSYAADRSTKAVPVIFPTW